MTIILLLLHPWLWRTIAFY